MIDYNIYTWGGDVKECVLHTYLTLESAPEIICEGVDCKCMSYSLRCRGHTHT